jgi:hypothetical protein
MHFVQSGAGGQQTIAYRDKEELSVDNCVSCAASIASGGTVVL